MLNWTFEVKCTYRVPEVGLEPTLPKREPDFESGASANSATPAAFGNSNALCSVIFLYSRSSDLG